MNGVIYNFFQEVGSIFLFVIKIKGSIKNTVKHHRHLIFEQISQVGVRSLSTVCFAGFFVGAILVIQFYLMLSQYDATSILGGLNTSACVREVGPLIISFLLAGKVGAYTAAELGTMRVTEQIDAISCLGTDPLEYLVVPRFIAIVICSLLLLVFGLLIGILGSIFVASTLYNINPLQYLSAVPRFTSGWTVFSGVLKSALYGTIVAAVSTYKGFHTSGGAKGVGLAVTQAAVYTNLLITLCNSFSSFFLDFLHHYLILLGVLSG